MTFEEWWNDAPFSANNMPGVFNAALRDLAADAWFAATKAEREACAEACDDISHDFWQQAEHGDTSGASDHMQTASEDCARAIRSRP